MAENRMTSGTAWKQILYFSLPVFVGLLLQQLYNTVDTIVVGNFASEAELSAVGTTGSLTFLFLAVANGFSAGAGVIASQYFGAGKMNELRKAASVSISLLMVMGLFATFAGIITGYPALKYLLAVPDSFLKISVS